MHTDGIQRHKPKDAWQINHVPAARVTTPHGIRARNDGCQGDVARNRLLLRTHTPRKPQHKARATGMAAQDDGAAVARFAQLPYQVDDVILVLADVLHIPPESPREIMPAHVGKNHLGDPGGTEIPRQGVIAAPVVGGAVNEDEDAVTGRIVKPVGQRIAIPRAELLQRGQVGGGFVLLGRKAENVSLRRHLRKGKCYRHKCDNHPDNPEQDQNEYAAKQVAQC